MEIVKDKAQLAIPVQPTKFGEGEIEEITEILTEELKNHGDDRVGLAANQLGLDVRACIINVKEPLVLINPRIKELSNNVVAYHEQCLSIDKSMVHPIQVQRSTEVTIVTDNLGELTFKPDISKWKDSDEYYSDLGMLECACVQHEIDHLNGITIADDSRRWFVPRKSDKTYRRNEQVMVRLEDGTTEFMKYKKTLAIPNCEVL
jgi:peptide deformylase